MSFFMGLAPFVLIIIIVIIIMIIIIQFSVY